MVARQTFRRHVSWNTKSNKNRLLKTPGGRLVYQVVAKKAKGAKCMDTGKPLKGMTAKRPTELKKLKKRQRKVSRAYGGCLSSGALKTRIMRAFLIEEQRCVKQVLQEKEKQRKEEEQPAASKKKKSEKKK